MHIHNRQGDLDLYLLNKNKKMLVFIQNSIYRIIYIGRKNYYWGMYYLIYTYICKENMYKNINSDLLF